MNILELINKLRKISEDDVIKNYKKIFIALSVMVLLIVIGNILVPQSKRLFQRNQTVTTYNDEDEFAVFEEESKDYVYSKPEAKVEVSTQQKDDFSEYNLLEISEVSIKENIAKISIKNTSDKEIKKITVTLVNKDNEKAMTLETDIDSKIKANGSITLEGFTLQEQLKVSEYSFYLNDEYINVNLLEKYAKTDSNTEIIYDGDHLE